MATLLICRSKIAHNRVFNYFSWGMCILLLPILTSPQSYADALPYDLPYLYTDIEGNSATPEQKSFLEESEDRIKLIDQQLREHTQKQLTQDSIIFLRRQGFILETQHFQGNIQTEIETTTEGDVTFTLKIPFK